MSITLIDSGNEIDFTNNGHIQSLPKEGLKVTKFSDDRFELLEENGTLHSFEYSDVSVPSTSTATDLWTKIKRMIRSIGAGTTTTAFGELSVESKTSQVQVKFPYNIPADLVQSLTNAAGSAITHDSAGQAVTTCDSAANSFSQIRSEDTTRYNAGQGSLFLGTALFTTGVADSSQVCGMGDDDEGFFFGYNGAAFGVLRRSGGSLEVKSIEITGVADAGGGNFDITLDGDAVNVIVGANATIQQIVAAIVAKAADFGNAGRGWEVHTSDGITVHFTSFVAENAAGSFSFADVDSSVTAGAFSEPVAGVAPTESWVTQADWNVDAMDGFGPSGMTLDPTKGNVYEIQFQYLGYGSILYGIEDPVTGRSQPVHRVNYANANTSPSLVNPTLHITTIIKTETGYSGGALVVKNGSLSGFIEGIETPHGIRRSASQEKSMTTTEQPIFIISNKIVFASSINKITAFPDFMSMGSESTKTTILRMYRVPTEITAGGALTDVQTGVSTIETGQAGTAIVGGEKIITFIFVGSDEIDLTKLGTRLRPGERYVITGELSSGSASLVDVSMTWVERI